MFTLCAERYAPSAEGSRLSLRLLLSDKEIHNLEKTSKAVGLPAEEIIRRSRADYLEKLRIESEFDPVGFGMWEGRIEMQDSTKWVQGLRSQEWGR